MADGRGATAAIGFDRIRRDLSARSMSDDDGREGRQSLLGDSTRFCRWLVLGCVLVSTPVVGWRGKDMSERLATADEGFSMASNHTVLSATERDTAIVVSVPSIDALHAETRSTLFYQPSKARSGDFMPYHHQGRFYLFHILMDGADDAGIPWHLISTEDFVTFTDHGVALPAGGKEDQDHNVFTGSVMFVAGMHHIFYTGNNLAFPDQGKPGQGVMHAVSSDLVRWTKIPEDTFFARTDIYEPHDWRDPFVFWNEDSKQYWMLVTARLKTGPSRRRGCLALCTSTDLKRWNVQAPFWAPGLFHGLECPDLFQMGQQWYLIFSEYSDEFRTRYRFSDSLHGPWLTPEDDVFDARAFYAAKSVSDGRRRYLCGWTPPRKESRDYGSWEFGGNLMVHQLQQRKNGALTAGICEAINECLASTATIEFSTTQCHIDQNADRVTINAHHSFGYAIAGTMPDRCKLETKVTFCSGTRGFGLVLRASDDLDASYAVCVDPQAQRLRFDCWLPGYDFRTGNIVNLTERLGALAGMERKAPVTTGTPVSLRLVVDDSIFVVYLDDAIAMTGRMYEMAVGRWGLFVDQGSATFTEIRMSM